MNFKVAQWLHFVNRFLDDYDAQLPHNRLAMERSGIAIV
jgi:hypothetical protein